MTNPYSIFSAAIASAILLGSVPVAASETREPVAGSMIMQQRATLAAATEGAGFGPQSPRDISSREGNNLRAFGSAPDYVEMNLCNIHFHENAEHKGGQFTTFAGHGDGHGYGTGFKYNGSLTAAELAPIDMKVGASEHGDLAPGDTIEIHFVHSSAQVTPGPTLGSCVSEAIVNPQLRVETVVAVLVNDQNAASLTELAGVEQVDGLYQVPNLPTGPGTPVTYDGSTTGPGYNEKGSPYQVTWSVRPQVIKLDINSVAAWLSDNMFDEDHAHGVRNLVMNPDLLSPIEN